MTLDITKEQAAIIWNLAAPELKRIKSEKWAPEYKKAMTEMASSIDDLLDKLYKLKGVK